MPYVTLKAQSLFDKPSLEPVCVFCSLKAYYLSDNFVTTILRLRFHHTRSILDRSKTRIDRPVVFFRDLTDRSNLHIGLVLEGPLSDILIVFK